MAVSKAQQKAVTKYVKNKYDRFGLTMPKGDLDAIKAHAEARGESVNGVVNRAISETIERDSAGGPQKAPESAQDGRGVVLPSDAFEAAQMAAKPTGENVAAFVARSVMEQAKRDKLSFSMGINPATGDMLK